MKKIILVGLLSAFVGSPSTLEASYRVYQMRIHHASSFEEPQRNEVVLSNLDPFQYGAFYGFSASDTVQLLDTWFCPGDTSNERPYCPKPIPNRIGPVIP